MFCRSDLTPQFNAGSKFLLDNIDLSVKSKLLVLNLALALDRVWKINQGCEVDSDRTLGGCVCPNIVHGSISPQKIKVHISDFFF